MENQLSRIILGFLVGGFVSVPLTVLIVIIRQSIKPFDSGMLMIGGGFFAILMIPAFISIFGSAVGAIASASSDANSLIKTALTLPVGLLVIWIYAENANKFNYADKTDYWLQWFISLSCAIFVFPCTALITDYILKKIKSLDSNSISE